uniref:Methyltransferase type 11 domain-containing protein n=1 Tax=Chromera velia CCMP2878 TaxID=1169474 RepID=A0A0G4HIM1_9ALVE|eukprot:Cvel_6966.t1-p1 / transcript=Cvel_6966.t1 / gene=Cvel_6966 / organism=Chromera_velia_CCMP2878 / gene_product=(S)-coclaurine N-methyltransferase, putative / transcript_product=(S)-coclaurine N-methyltransferase, putative / location=Cvel_scaffold353:59539-66567(+) / protein_length=422 / sequence_SO=supercontig / SO=protein_coding / is_pseudo=false
MRSGFVWLVIPIALGLIGGGLWDPSRGLFLGLWGDLTNGIASWAMDHMASQGIPKFFGLFEKGRIPDGVTRFGIRQLLGWTLRGISASGVTEQEERFWTFYDELNTMPIAVNTEDANAQHYEVDARFYDLVLGRRRKYSAALYEDVNVPVQNAADLLNEAEDRMLRLYAERAGIDLTSEVPLRVLDLGCGWGSVSLWLAENCERCSVVGLSNSNSQREWIMRNAKERGVADKLQVVTGNVAVFEFDFASSDSPVSEPFDVVISIEMFEHMKNYKELFRKIDRWLRPGGFLFVHIFQHRLAPYHFVEQGEADWMSRFFFSGGTMPSPLLLPLAASQSSDLKLEKTWAVDGRHYALTLEAWLQRMDAQETEVRKILREAYGDDDETETKWFWRWRGFFLACAETFRFNGGSEWYVSHYRFSKPI